MSISARRRGADGLVDCRGFLITRLDTTATGPPSIDLSPPVLDDLDAALVGADGFGMVLQAPERFLGVPDGHEHRPVVGVVQIPCQRDQVGTGLAGFPELAGVAHAAVILDAVADVDVQRVIPHRPHLFHPVEDGRTTVDDIAVGPVRRQGQSPDRPAKGASQVLEAQAHAQHRDHLLVRHLPELTHRRRVSRLRRISRTRPDHDGVYVLQQIRRQLIEPGAATPAGR